MSNIGRTGDLHDDSNDDREDTRDVERDAQHAADSDVPEEEGARDGLTPNANPPRTTKGWFTAPKFGSASSGGGEIEPGPEKD
ncbi:MAG TPA: hypothetical protein VN600_12670 [Gemmatimonadaceae bacterium]|nr:hypothetical protein [Gemmatimonadaceae bacterium]